MTEALPFRQAGLAGLWLFAAVALLSIAAQNVVFVGMAAWLTWRLRSGQGLPTVPAPLRWALPFLAWALLASFLAPNRSHSLETWRRWLLVFVAVYAAGALTSERSLRAVLGSLLFFSGLWCLGASLWALWGPWATWLQGESLAALLSRWPNEGGWRAVSGSGGYMVLGTGSMLLLCLFSGLCLEDARWRKPLNLSCLLALALALALTQTRSAWLGAAVGLGFLAFLRRPKMAALGLAALLALLLLWPANPVTERLRQGVDMKQGSTRERVFMLRGARELMLAHPWLGIGDSLESWQGPEGRQEGYYVRVQRPHAQAWGFPLDAEQGHLHNNLNQLAVMYGIPGAILFLALSLALAWAAWRARLSASPLARGLGWGLCAAWAAWWVNGSLEFNFGSTQSSFTLWFLWGLGLAAFRLEPA